MAFPGGAVAKNLPANAGNARDEGSIPGLGRSLGEGNDNPLQYSCLKNAIDRRAWRVTVQEVAELDTTEYTHTYAYYAYIATYTIQVQKEETGLTCFKT